MVFPLRAAACLAAASLGCWSSYREYAQEDVPRTPWECPPPSIDADLAVTTIDTLYLVARDGTTREAARFEAPAAILGGQAVTAAGPWIAALSGSADESTGVASVEMLVACRTGGVVWRRSETLPYQSWGNEASVRGSADGVFVFTFRFGESSLVVAAWPDGETVLRESYLVRGRPAEDGKTLVWRADAVSSEEFEWFDPLAGSFAATRYADGGSGSRLVVADMLAYGIRGGPELRVEASDDAWTIPVSWPSGSPGYLPLERTDGDRWILIEEREGPGEITAYSTVDLVARAGRRFVLSPPPGLWAWSDPADSTPGMRIAQDGSVFEVYRDARQASLMRTRDGASWERVGRPVTGVDRWHAVEAGDTFVFAGAVTGAGGVDWEPGADPDALSNTTKQLVSPDGGTVLERATFVHLAHDGRAASGLVEGRLVRFDAATGGTTESDASLRGGRFASTFTGGEDRRLPDW